MYKILIGILLISEVVFAASFNDSVLIGGTGPADSKAQLDVKSTSKGVLLPRMTTTQQNAITGPTEGLIIYDNVLHLLSFYNGSGWLGVSSTNASLLASGTLNTARLPTPMQLGNGSVSSPAYSFTSGTDSGLYRIGADNIGMAVGGALAFDCQKISAGNFSCGLGTASDNTGRDVLNASGNVNTYVNYNFDNTNTGSASETRFQILNGSSNPLIFANLNYTTSPAYLAGTAYISASGFLAGLNLMAENSGAYIAFNTSGRTLATERMRLTNSALTINKGTNLVLSGATSGALTINAGATGTYSINYPTANAAGFTVNDGSGNLSWRVLAGTDLPNPSASTLGGIQSKAAVGSNWINSISTSGVPSASQPAFSDISGTASLTSQVTGTLPIANGGTNNSALAVTAGGIPYTDGSKLVNVGAGSSGQVLKSNGASPPSWGAVAGTTIPVTVESLTSGTTYNLDYYFTITSGNATIGATYTHNAITYTVTNFTVASSTFVVMSGSAAPLSSGTLTKASGTGDATLTFSSFNAPTKLHIRMVGGGGSGAGSGTAAGTAGVAGGNTTWASTVLVANGGSPGVYNGSGGAGGTASLGTGQSGNAVGGSGGSGAGTTSSGTVGGAGGGGGSSIFGGAGYGGSPNNIAGGDASANSGSGGGGAGSGGGTPARGGGGGGSGGSADAWINPPISATYTYAIGSGGSGVGTAGTGGSAGGSGAAGKIYVEAFY